MDLKCNSILLHNFIINPEDILSPDCYHSLLYPVLVSWVLPLKKSQKLLDSFILLNYIIKQILTKIKSKLNYYIINIKRKF